MIGEVLAVLGIGLGAYAGLQMVLHPEKPIACDMRMPDPRRMRVLGYIVLASVVVFAGLMVWLLFLASPG